ncbi:unnamed protein product [Amoebophrya sp. A120]|nr:unnamed protein product [Amoebophrya sp. A120]|eukprot:GSA120T00012327001.1
MFSDNLILRTTRACVCRPCLVPAVTPQVPCPTNARMLPRGQPAQHAQDSDTLASSTRPSSCNGHRKIETYQQSRSPAQATNAGMGCIFPLEAGRGAPTRYSVKRSDYKVMMMQMIILVIVCSCLHGIRSRPVLPPPTHNPQVCGPRAVASPPVAARGGFPHARRRH